MHAILDGTETVILSNSIIGIQPDIAFRKLALIERDGVIIKKAIKGQYVLVTRKIKSLLEANNARVDATFFVPTCLFRVITKNRCY